MILTSETRDGVVILKVSGRLIFDESLLTLRAKVRETLQSEVKGFVFDLSEVPHCDSSGCGEIIGAYAAICKAGASVAFVSPSPRVRVLWERIKLTEVFNLFDSLAEAENFVRDSGLMQSGSTAS